MFGKLAAISSYMKIWDVYLVKRFSSNKLSLWGMILSYSLCAWFASRMILIQRTERIKYIRENKMSVQKFPFRSGIKCF